MKAKSSFNKSTLPVFVLLLIIIKILYLGLVFMTQMEMTQGMLKNNLLCLADNLTWVPMAVFFAYFYMYRVGDVKNDGLKNALFCALFASIPKIVVMWTMLNVLSDDSAMMKVYYIADIVAWICMSIFLVFYWRNDFKLKDHHHHHHHHHHSVSN